MNALLVITIIFTAITLLFSVTFVNMAYKAPVDKSYPVEGTKVFVRYSSVKDSGIYEGYVATGTLKLKGQFGYEWGATAEGDTLLLNEYKWTDLGLVTCDLVSVDLDTFEKTVVFKDVMLRGRCASGEAVCVSGAAVLSNLPAGNPLWKFYALTNASVKPSLPGAEILIIDPATYEVLWSARDPEALDEGVVESRYLEKTLDEVRQ